MIMNNVIHVNTDNRVMFIDITEKVQNVLKETEISNGTVFIFTPHTTCSVFIEENSDDETFWGTEYLMQDLLNVFDKIIPPCTSEGQYLFPGPKHVEEAKKRGEKPNWTLNADGHLRSVLVGQSIFVPLIDKSMYLGSFGRIFFVDFDQIRARERKIVIQINGE